MRHSPCFYLQFTECETKKLQKHLVPTLPSATKEQHGSWENWEQRPFQPGSQRRPGHMGAETQGEISTW